MTKITVQNPTRPSLLLSPGESRDRNGPVTPTVDSSVEVVDGAWSRVGFSGVSMNLPDAGMYSNEKFSMLVRCKIIAGDASFYPAQLTGEGEVRFRCNATDLGYRFEVRVGDPPIHRIGTIGAEGVDQLYLEHGVWYTLALVIDQGVIKAWVDGQITIISTYNGSVKPNRFNLAAQGSGGSLEWAVRSNLIFPEALTDAEIQRISTMPEAWTWQNASLTERMLDDEIEVVVPKGKSGLNIIETKVHESDMFGVTGREIPVTNAKMTSDIDRAGSKTRVEIETVYLNPEYQYSIGPGRWVSVFQEIARENEGIERVQRGVFELGQPAVLSKGSRDHVTNSGSDVVNRLARASVLDTFYTPVNGHVMSDIETAIRMLGITSMGPDIVLKGGFEGGEHWSSGHTGGGSSSWSRHVGGRPYGGYGTIHPPEGNAMAEVIMQAGIPLEGGRYFYSNHPTPSGAQKMYASALVFRGGRADNIKLGIGFRKDGTMTEVASHVARGREGGWTRLFVVTDVPEWGDEVQVSLSITYGSQPSPTWDEAYFIDDIKLGTCTGDLLPESVLALPPSDTLASNRIQHLPGETLLAAVNDRLASVGMMAVHATPDSKFTSRRARDTATDATVRTFHLNKDVRMIGDVTVERSVTSMYNRVFAIKEDFTTGESMIAIAENDNVSDPWSIHNILLEPKIVTSQDAADLQVLQDLADAELARASMQTSIKFGILPDPALTVYDMIYIEGPPGHRVAGRWAIESIESGLTTDNPLMIIGARRSTR